jgi:hypothetical protein
VKLKYAVQLRRSNYLEVLSPDEWTGCPMTLNSNRSKILNFVKFSDLSQMSQQRSVKCIFGYDKCLYAYIKFIVTINLLYTLFEIWVGTYFLSA